MASSVSDPDPAAAPPLIGVTTYLQRAQTGVWDLEASFLPRVYMDGVIAAGGVPVLLPPQPTLPGVVDAVLERLDGLIVAGGADVDPARYGAEAHPRTDAPQTLRDEWEFALLERALELDLPFLGICRGMQVLNVLRGGTLHQHLPDVVGDARYQLGRGVFARVAVEVDEGSRLATLVGERIQAPVYHHQAIDRPGEGLVATARSADGIVEAVELEGATHGLAVQWHPEEDPDDRRLFQSVVDAARAHRDRRKD
ncbi:gamma-glutamyl-gamma-aminobutyrate hydrolase family protein [Microbacterium paludicola]|uniref:gamma-glutamyl-gamma-aminobutyrate hydrolase family protein n=1 Tax=Microbacterium paludicola TaxID=300019 RepID=UPI001ADD84F3|nr:gamma-glutamyl-gamma-aminobutyrate hydrolase family protein [Microbacterium paludicola]